MVFRFASLTLGQSYAFHSVTKVILKAMSKIGVCQTTTKHNKAWTMWLFLWMCCMVCRSPSLEIDFNTSHGINVEECYDDVILWKSALLAICEENMWIFITLVSPYSSQIAYNSDLWYFLSCKPEQAVEQTVKLLVIWVAMTLMWCPYNADGIHPV